MFCSTLPFSFWWRRCQFFAEEKQVTNNVEDEEVAIMEKKVFRMERALLFSARSPSHCQQNLWSKRLSQTNVVKQAIHLLQKASSFSDPFDNVVYDAHEEVNSTHPWLTNQLSNILGFRQEERVYRRKKNIFVLSNDESGAEEHCAHNGHCTEIYQAWDSGHVCLYLNVPWRQGLHTYPQAQKVYGM